MFLQSVAAGLVPDGEYETPCEEQHHSSQLDVWTCSVSWMSMMSSKAPVPLLESVCSLIVVTCFVDC